MSSQKVQIEKPTVYFDYRVYNLMAYWALLGGQRTPSQEITSLGLVKIDNGKIYVYDVFLMDQDGTSGHVEASEEGVMKLMMMLDQKNIPLEHLRCWMHSHPGTGPGATFFSGTDDANITRWLTGDFLISIVFDSKGAHPKARIDVKVPRCYMDVNIEIYNYPWLSEEDQKWASEEFQKNVRERKLTASSLIGFQGSGNQDRALRRYYEGYYSDDRGYYGDAYDRPVIFPTVRKGDKTEAKKEAKEDGKNGRGRGRGNGKWRGGRRIHEDEIPLGYLMEEETIWERLSALDEIEPGIPLEITKEDTQKVDVIEASFTESIQDLERQLEKKIDDISISFMCGSISEDVAIKQMCEVGLTEDAAKRELTSRVTQ